MRTLYWGMLFSFGFSIQAAVDPLATTAEYYFSRADYPKAFELWGKYRQLHPENFQGAIRLSDLKFYFEGRESAVKELQKYSQATGMVLNAEHRRLAREKHYTLATTFLTEEGQSLYFRALQREKMGDTNTGLALLQQAAPLEKANFLVSKARARMEKNLGMRERMYQTLISARDMFPFDVDVMENLFELQVHFGAPAEVISSIKKARHTLLTPREKLAGAIAHAEVGDPAQALSLLQDIVSKEKQITVHPIAYFYLGKLHANRNRHSPEAVYFLERYKIALTRPESFLIEGWDPYKTTEKSEEADKLLVELKSR